MKARDVFMILIVVVGVVALPLLFRHVVGLTLRTGKIEMRLPSSTTVDTKAVEPLLIGVDGKGVVYNITPDGRVVLDEDPTVHEVPGLKMYLKLYADGVRAAGGQPLVQIDADPESTQQRVLDILNALKAEGITSVTFHDLLDR